MSLPRGLYEIAYDILGALQQEGPLNLTAIYRKTPTDKYTRTILDILLAKGLITEHIRPKAFLKTTTKTKVAAALEKGERPPKTYERVFTITEKGVEAFNQIEELNRILKGTK